MHRHDQDLIMALAEGTLSGTAAEAARADVESCAECRLDLQAQTAALEWLATTEPVELSELEVARLRRNIDAELGHERAPVAAPAQAKGSRWAALNWGALAGAAAVLVGVVFVAGSLTLVGGGDDSSDLLVGLDEPAAETFAPASDRLLQDQVRSSVGAGSDDAADAAGAPEESVSAEAEAPESTVAAFATTAAPAGAAGDAADLDSGPLDEILAQLQDAEGDTDLAIGTLLDTSTLVFRISTPEVNCLSASDGLIDDVLLRAVVGLVDLPDVGELQVIAHYGENDEVLGVSGHDPIGCAPLSLLVP